VNLHTAPGEPAAAAAPRQLAGDPTWWRGGVIYQIYPRSFLDTNGDGIGDLAGIAEKLDYVARLNVDAIWLSPHFRSPMRDFGYDVCDYRDVDPIFGTLEDFDALIEAAHARGLRILIDLVLSHTSDEHPWFRESRSSRINAKADWYVWADPKPDGTPPNNWLSVFGGPAWEWDTARRQYYMHNFLASQPDLNFHNPEVQDAVLDVARYWLDRGVDGFRLDTANKYFHDAALRDNPPLGPGMRVSGLAPENPAAMQQPIHQVNRPETVKFHERLRALMDGYPGTTTVGEIGARLSDGPQLAEYTAPGRLHMAYSFDLLTKPMGARQIRAAVEAAEASGATWTSWPFSNHDVERVATRSGLGVGAATMLNQLMLCLRGTPTVYQGDELGLPEAHVPYEKLQDPYGKRFWPAAKGRDGCRTPMPWRHDAPHAGFTTGEPWLPVDPAHVALAVDLQEDDPQSTLNHTRAFIEWRRRQPVLRTGKLRFLDTPDPILAFTRSPDGEAGDDGDQLLCVFNLSEKPGTLAIDTGGLAPLAPPGMGGGTMERGMLRFDGFGALIAALGTGT